MKRMMSAFLGTLIFFSLTGCFSASKSNIIEEISPSILLFVDRNEKGKFVHTTIIPPARKENIQLLTKEANLMNEARNEFSKGFYREMKTGQLRILMISKTIAESGILPILNTLKSDPEISSRLFISVVEGDFVDYLNGQIEKKQELPIEIYLYRMFTHYEKQGELTITNLHRFMESYFSPYADPVAPLFKATKDELTYQGTALFHGGRMVGQIDGVGDILFQLQMDKYASRKVVPLPEMQISLGSILSHSQIKVLPDRSVHVRLDLRGRIEEYHGDRNLMDHKEAKALQREIESYLKKKLAAVIRELQQQEIDPIRIGERTLTPLKRPYSSNQWRKAWKKVPIKTEVNLRMDNLGLQQE